MAQYFLYLRRPDGSQANSEGVRLAHLGRLHESVERVAKDLVCDDPGAAEWTVEVWDEAGRKLLTEKLGNFRGPC